MLSNQLKKISYLILSLIIISICAGCGNKNVQIDFTKIQENTPKSVVSNEPPLRVAFASVITPQKTRHTYQAIINAISKEMNRPVILLQRKTYEELNILLANGEADIAFISTGAYASYHGIHPIELLSMVKTNNTIFYQTYIIVPSDSKITAFEQLRGHTFAFTDPLSYSGKMAIDNLLYKYKDTPESFFSNYFYTYNHDKSLVAVADHLADAASIDSQVYDHILTTNPKLAARVKIIERLEEAPTGPIVVQSTLPLKDKQKLQDILFNLHNNKDIQPQLSNIMIDQFVPPQPNLYKKLKEQYDMRYRYFEKNKS